MKTRTINFTLAIISGLALLLHTGIAKADDVSIDIKGLIDSGSLNAQTAIVKTLTRDDTLEVNIDSRGGFVPEGLKLCEAIVHSPAKLVTVNINNQAASAAAEIALCSDKINMTDNAQFMMHLGDITYDSGKKVYLSKYMDITQLDTVDRAYLTRDITFIEYALTNIGVDHKHVDMALSTPDGLAIQGWRFKKINPTGTGLRKDNGYIRLYRTLTLD